jgi:hypothetical protein
MQFLKIHEITWRESTLPNAEAFENVPIWHCQRQIVSKDEFLLPMARCNQHRGSVEVTRLETDTSITNLPFGRRLTHGVELDRPRSMNREDPELWLRRGCHTELTGYSLGESR